MSKNLTQMPGPPDTDHKPRPGGVFRFRRCNGYTSATREHTMKRLILSLALAASPLAIANSDPCPPGAAVKQYMADGYTMSVSNSQRIKTASKTANDAIQRCIRLLSQFKLGMAYDFPSAEAMGAAAIQVVVDRACQEVYKVVQNELVKHDPKGYVTTGKNFDLAAMFGEYLDRKFPSTGSTLVSDILNESERDIQGGGFINTGEFLKKAGSDPRSVAKANAATEAWLKRYEPKREEQPKPAPQTSATNSFWSWNNSDFKP